MTDDLEETAAETTPWYAPFTAEQVAELGRWQTAGWVHPFTCGNGALHAGYHVILMPTTKGWICPDDRCDFTQDWCHPFMADGSLPAKSPLEMAMEIADAAATMEPLPLTAPRDDDG